MKWKLIANDPPPQDVVLETKIDDGCGERNLAKLVRSKRMWFFPDMSMYVYYTPTHWREVPRESICVFQ